MHIHSTLASARLILLCLVGFPVAASGQVLVNEVSASNWSSYPDNSGQFEDWIELFNSTANPVDLTGWYLSDSQNNNTKWQFPAGATIPANGHLVVFCDGRNTTIGNEHHTGFKLNQTDEERAVLSDPSAAIVSNFQLEQRTQADHSWGRTSDGAATWNLFTTPTPGAPNTAPLPYYASKPVLDPPAGNFAGGIAVSMTSPDPGTEIRYTVDGSTPGPGSALYSAPVAVNATTVLRAACFPTAAGIPPSFVETNTYLINAGHGVPVVSICGDEVADLLNGNQIEPTGSLEYFGDDGLFRGEAEGDFNKHGNDSWAYDQRGIDYVARDEFGANDAMRFKVFRTKNREHFQRLILKAAASDNYPFENGGAHIRDAFVQALSHEGDLKLDERTYEPCVLYLNGQYWGVYEVREKVDDHDFTSYYYDQDREDLYYLKTWGGTWEEYGQGFALDEWNTLQGFINANDMGDAGNFAYVEGLLNWQSLVDYFVLNSYIVSKDWLNWNTGWWRGLDPAGDGRRWRYTLWDMDACFGHYVNFTSIPDESPQADPCNAESLPDPGGQGHTNILQKLLDENESVYDYYVNRYIDLGNTVFSCDNMLPFLDSLVALIEPEMQRHTTRWGGSVGEWQANVQAMRTFIETRCTAIQGGLVDCYDLEGPYDVVFNVDPPLSGHIRINSVTPDTYPFAGMYYGGIATELAPLPEPGWVFSHWEVFSTNTLLPTTTDSLVTVDILAADSIVAHFVPPTRHEVLLDVFPRNGATIVLDGQLYTQFPVLLTVPDNVSVPFEAFPAEYHEFLYWQVKNAQTDDEDSTLIALSARFLTTDTIVAFLKPEDHTYFVPNAFTPNGDGINDIFQPLGNAIEAETYNLIIFDRWGNELLNTKDRSAGWDGTVGGLAAPNGVYVFRADLQDAISNERHEFQGHVTLFR
jgi:gliding motility-associated-like protein